METFLGQMRAPEKHFCVANVVIVEVVLFTLFQTN
jgi:hypothetical protein